jgi:acyl-CoA reductase-like NAD-dependent aldehyde dehydrogenase
MLVRGFHDPRAAVDAANRSRFALAASVWGRDARRARALAGQIQAGMVTINDAVTPTGHASAPFGGAKASGFGRTKGLFGLREFVQPQVLCGRRAGGMRPQLYPYSRAAWLDRCFSLYRFLFHRARS